MVAAMARHLLSQPAPGEARAQIDCDRIKVTKPDIFGGRAAPSVELPTPLGSLRARRSHGYKSHRRSRHRRVSRVTRARSRMAVVR
jgi:hypothetical protein